MNTSDSAARAAFDPLTADAGAGGTDLNLDVILDVPVSLSLEVEGTSLFAGEFGTHNGKNAIKITHVHQPRSLIPLDSLG